MNEVKESAVTTIEFNYQLQNSIDNVRKLYEIRHKNTIFNVVVSRKSPRPMRMIQCGAKSQEKDPLMMDGKLPF